jgi:hypothetical protein
MNSAGQIARSKIALGAGLLLFSASVPPLQRAEDQGRSTSCTLSTYSAPKMPRDSPCYPRIGGIHRSPCVHLWLPTLRAEPRSSKSGAIILVVLHALPDTRTGSPSSRSCGTNRSVVYRNARFGFTFCLPREWEGYRIVMRSWAGGDPNGSSMVERGPEILIRHPKWTSAAPREDIPIMVFTRAQWELVRREKIIVSAAPFGPSELGSNGRYVFALPPRFDYDELTGFEEVDAIVRSHPLHAF